MTSGFGVDRTSDGSSGTTASDIRKIWGGIYSPGVINGCSVERSSSSMSYTVKAGVVAIDTGTNEVVLAPISETTVTAPANSGSHTDIVYAQQRYPSIEGDANIKIGVGSSLPSRSVLLAKYSIPSGASNTNSGVNLGDVDYSIPYGASLGLLHKYTDTTVGKYNNGVVTKGNGTIRLPTDRRLRFALTTTLWADGSSGFDNAHYAEYAFVPKLNGNDLCIWTTPGLHQAWATLSFEAHFNVAKGTHTVNYEQFRMTGNTDVFGFYGTDGKGYKRTGTTFTITDDGPSV